jgi:hypothetical protein
MESQNGINTEINKKTKTCIDLFPLEKTTHYHKN